MINLDTPISIGMGVTADGYRLENFHDFTTEKKCVAFISYFSNGRIVHQAEILVWDGSDYDLAGDYTQSDLETKLTQLIK